MAVAFRASTLVAAASRSPITVTKPTGTVLNDLLVAYIAWNNSGGTTITGVPSGWSTIDVFVNGTDLGVSFYSKVAGGSEPANYSWTLSVADTCGAIMHCYSGCSTTSPIAAHSIVRTTTASVTTTAITVPASAWFLCFFGDFNLSATFTTPAGLTNRVTNGNQVSYDSNAPDPGSITASTTISGSNFTSYGEAIALAVAGAVATRVRPLQTHEVAMKRSFFIPR